VVLGVLGEYSAVQMAKVALVRLTVALLLAGLMLCLYGDAHADVAELALRRMCSPAAVRLAPLVRAEARLNLLPVVSLVAVMYVESRCRSGVVNPVSGAAGLMQILPHGSADGGYPPDDLRADDLNVKLGAAHLGRLLVFCGAWSGALSVFSGFRYCRSTRYSRRVQALERRFWRWISPLPGSRLS
jgi:hypothetical protein